MKILKIIHILKRNYNNMLFDEGLSNYLGGLDYDDIMELYAKSLEDEDDDEDDEDDDEDDDDEDDDEDFVRNEFDGGGKKKRNKYKRKFKAKFSRLSESLLMARSLYFDENNFDSDSMSSDGYYLNYLDNNLFLDKYKKLDNIFNSNEFYF
jgi:hypothetical protein